MLAIVKEDYTRLLEEFIASKWRPKQILLEDNTTEYSIVNWDDKLLSITKYRLEIRCRANSKLTLLTSILLRSIRE